MALSAENPIGIPLFLGLWTEADDQGVFEWKPLTLKARILPAAPVDIGGLLEDLAARGCIKAFEVDGRKYGAIRKFRQWQKPKTPNALYPLPPEIAVWVGLKPPISEMAAGEAASFPKRFRNASEKPLLMEEGGGRKEDSDADASGGESAAVVETGPEPPPDPVPPETPREAPPGEPLVEPPAEPLSVAGQIWKAGVPFLVAAGIREGPARSMLGKWRKEHGDAATLHALIAAERQAVSEPVAWIQGVLMRGGGQNGLFGGGRNDGRNSGRSSGAEQRQRQRAAALASLG